MHLLVFYEDITSEVRIVTMFVIFENR
jgi:hypothetical protein